jgi:hypothetical protein
MIYVWRATRRVSFQHTCRVREARSHLTTVSSLPGFQLIEAGTSAVYNKAVKGVKVAKGPLSTALPRQFAAVLKCRVVLGIAFPTCISVNVSYPSAGSFMMSQTL